MDLISLVGTSVFQSMNAAANDPEDTPNTITQVPNPNATLGILTFEALPVLVAAAVLDAATDPRLKVGVPGFPVDAAAGLDGPPGIEVAAAEAAAVGNMSVAVELTPGSPVPDGMTRMLDVEVAFRAACAIAISLFAMS